jgi:hypothetical protein
VLVIDSSEPSDRQNRLDVALDPDRPDDLWMIDMLGPDNAASRFLATVDVQTGVTRGRESTIEVVGLGRVQTIVFAEP